MSKIGLILMLAAVLLAGCTGVPAWVSMVDTNVAAGDAERGRLMTL